MGIGQVLRQRSRLIDIVSATHDSATTVLEGIRSDLHTAIGRVRNSLVLERTQDVCTNPIMRELPSRTQRGGKERASSKTDELCEEHLVMRPLRGQLSGAGGWRSFHHVFLSHLLYILYSPSQVPGELLSAAIRTHAIRSNCIDISSRVLILACANATAWH